MKSKTSEGRSATFRVQGLGFFSFFFLDFSIFSIFDLDRFTISRNISRKKIEPSRGGYSLEASLFLLSLMFFDFSTLSVFFFFLF